MSRVDFYILAETLNQGRERLACRLAEKAYRLGHQVYIHTDSAAASQQLDELLWTFRAGSFVPHGPYGSEDDPAPPVLIGHASEPEPALDVLINLATEVPLFLSRFPRIVEIVEPAHRDEGRQRFRFYRDRGYPLHSHNVSL